MQAFRQFRVALPLLFIAFFNQSAQAFMDNIEAIRIQGNGDFAPKPHTEEELTYHTAIHDSNIKTLIMHTSVSELEAPVIELDGQEQLVLRFDDLSEDTRDMYYEFEHCTYDWKSSELDTYDYQEGYESDVILDYKYSFNTLIPFTHYALSFPNDRIALTQSGNYVIRVFAENDKEQPILTARFMVVEPLSSITPNVMKSKMVSERDYQQDVELKINLNRVPTLNPYGEIEMVVMQNYRWDNAKYNVKPSFTSGKDLVYNQQGPLTFDGTNEYRKIDAKSVKYRTEEIAAVSLEEDGYHIILAPDLNRAYKKYSFDQDINGKFLIKNDDMFEPHLEADYVWMHFTVPVDAIFGSGKMHLYGQISQWQLGPEFEMDFNSAKSAYEAKHLVKQGYYNYMYLWERADTKAVSTDYTEGNHSDTENDYQVFIYFKDSRAFCHRLVGYKLFNTSGQ